jgi:ubiquinone/menaquinone biosynthesis C-methylase UbiE
MQTPEQLARKTFGERAAYYTTSVVHSDPKVLEDVVRFAAPGPEWVALDVATGTGHTALALAPHVARVVALDLTPEMLREAEALIGARGIGSVELRTGDVHDLPFPDGSFDLVTCRRAAHHFSDIRRALAEMRRVLRPGGRIVIDDRSVPEDDFVDALMNELDTWHDPSHVREYRPSEWRQMLEEAGFAVREVAPYTIHRSLTALTRDVADEGVRAIRARIAALTPDEREKLSLVEKDGEPHHNHWFVMLAADRID